MACLEKSDQRGLALSPKSGGGSESGSGGGSAWDWFSAELFIVPVEDEAMIPPKSSELHTLLKEKKKENAQVSENAPPPFRCINTRSDT